MEAVPEASLKWRSAADPEEATPVQSGHGIAGRFYVAETIGADPVIGRKLRGNVLRSLMRSTTSAVVSPALSAKTRQGALDAFEVAELLCSRLCHDLIGPAGAVSAGVELLDDNGGHDAEALELVAASAKQLTNRLAFFRVALGRSGSARGTLTLKEAETLIIKLLEGGRVELGWLWGVNGIPGTPDPIRDHPADAVRLLLCLALVAGETLRRGGRLSIRLTESKAGVAVTITAAGKDACIGQETAEAISGKNSMIGLTSRNVHAHYLGRLAERLGTVVQIDHAKPDEVRLAALLPTEACESAPAMATSRSAKIACGAI